MTVYCDHIFCTKVATHKATCKDSGGYFCYYHIPEYWVIKSVENQMRSKEFKHTAVTNWLDMVDSKCPACGDFIDYCQGHGEIGDPEGYAIIKQQEETA